MVLAGLLAVVTDPARPAAAAALAGQTTRVSVSNDLEHPDAAGSSDHAAVTGDGQQVTFASLAAIDPLDATNDAQSADYDIYLRDRVAGRTLLLTRGTVAPPPVVTNPGDQRTMLGDSVTLAMSATSQVQPVTWDAGGLPSGLSIDRDTGTISGTPTIATTYHVVVTATATPTRRSGEAFFDWVIEDLPAPTVANPGNQSTFVGTAVTLANSASGGRTPYRWSAANLPAGLSIDAGTGTISGTPTTPVTANVVLTATGANNKAGTAAFVWTVTRRPVPILTIATDMTDRMDPPRVPVGPFHFTVSGGTAPYEWTFIGSNFLPPGITASFPNGPTGNQMVWSGTPTRAGYYNISMIVTSSDRGRADLGFLWIIENVVVGPGLVSPATATALAAAAAPDAQEWPADGGSSFPSVSATGRYVAFQTNATNLTVDDADTATDVVVLDRDPNGDGVLDQPKPGGTVPDYVYLYAGQRRPGVEGGRANQTRLPSISADGTVVAWQDVASSGLGRVRITKLRDDRGMFGLPSTDPFEDAAAPTLVGYRLDDMGAPVISGDGRHVLFTARYECALDACPGASSVHMLVDYDRTTRTPTRIDTDEAGKPLPDDSFGGTAISADGRIVAFTHFTDGDGLPLSEVYVEDRGAPSADGTFPGPATTWIASRDAAGKRATGAEPALSADGRYLAYVTDANGVHNGWDRSTGTGSCLYEASSPSFCDVVARDLVRDRARRAAGVDIGPAELVSPGVRFPCVIAPPISTPPPTDAPAGPPPNSTCEGDGHSERPAVSANGRFVAFDSLADDLIADDANESGDVFVREFIPALKGVPIDFGTVQVGDHAVETSTVTVEGFGPVPISTVTIAPTTDFTLDPGDTCRGTVRHEGDSCVISVKFAPTVTGKRTATITVSGGSLPIRPLAQIATTGGVGPPRHDAIAEPGPLAFGDQLLLTPSGPAILTVTNQGTREAETITTAVLDGEFAGDYAITRNACQGAVLKPGASCRITLTHTPHAVGQRQGFVRITHGPLNTTLLAGLTGGGRKPTLAVNPGVVGTGGLTYVQATDFPAGRAFTLDLGPVLGVVTRAYDGTAAHNGTARTPVLIFNMAAVPCQVWALIPGLSDARGILPGMTTQISVPLLIVPGTVQPGFNYRR